MSDGAVSGSRVGRDIPEGDAAGFGDAARVAPGTVIGGRFVVEGLLGAGGMGVVVLARHRELGELRAIKLLRSDRALDDGARRRLQREARAAARIRSAHVVRVFDVVTDDAESPYVVMEHLVGETLSARLRRGPLPVFATARLVVEACEALAEAHRAGTVHRDLKPSNLFLTSTPVRDDFVKILDFGIAKIEEARFVGDWTHSRALLATPAYASPEQLRASRDVDVRSDIWSLGVIIYECLTGRLPFEAGTLAETSSRILRDEPSPMRGGSADVPAALERVVMRCLAKSREARFRDLEALVEALSPFAPEAAAACLDHVRALPPAAEAASRPFAAEPAAQRDETLSQSSLTEVAPDGVRAGGGARRRPRLAPWGAALGGVAVSVALAAVWLSRSARPDAGVSPPPAQARVGATVSTPTPPAAVLPPALPSPAQPSPRLAETAVPDRRARPHRPRPASSGAITLRPTVAAPAAAPAVAPRDPGLAPLEQLRLDQLIDERK